MLTITLPPEIESRLKSEASRQGLGITEFATRLLDEALPKPDQASLDVLERWEAAHATTDPEEIARRQVEFDQFKEAMNRNRSDTEGADARKVFP
jgi:hypothetical protein